MCGVSVYSAIQQISENETEETPKTRTRLWRLLSRRDMLCRMELSQSHEIRHRLWPSSPPGATVQRSTLDPPRPHLLALYVNSRSMVPGLLVKVSYFHRSPHASQVTLAY
jgi:hypothetical protein